MSESEREALIKSIHDRTQQIANLKLPDISGIDLTMPQLRLVILLYHHRRMRVSDIATIFHVTSATVSGIVERLVERGFVTRQADPDDRRAVICCLTAQGQEILDTFWNTQNQLLDSVLGELSVAHLKAYDNLLLAVTEIMMRQSRASADAAA